MGTTWVTRAVRAARVVLGLPAQRPAPAAEDVDAWVAAGRPPETGPGPAKASATAAGSPAHASAVPWTDMEEDRRRAALRKVARIAFWAVVLLAAVTGVRSWVAPDRPAPVPAPVAAVPAPSFPADAARQVAARWARSYLTWDAARPQDHEAALAADMAVGADARQGWDRAGRQDVVDVAAGQVTVTGADRARVRVDVLVHPHPAAPAAPPATAGPSAPPGTQAPQLADGPRWVALDVPVAVAGHRVVVTGLPGLLGLPSAPATVPAAPGRPADSALGTQTHDAVGAFFAAAGDGGDVAALAAPGAEVAPLPPGFAFAGLRSWQVDVGSGDTRTGTATVLWQVGGGQLTQVYRVEMTRVTAAAGQRWQVAAVHGGDA